MDNLTLAIEILTRCETEKKRLEEYEKEYADVEKAGERFTWKKWNEVYNKYKPIPKKRETGRIDNEIKRFERYYISRL